MAGRRTDARDGDGWDDDPADVEQRPIRSGRWRALLATGVVATGLLVAHAHLPTGDAALASAAAASAGSGDPEPAPDPDVECMGSSGFRPSVLTRLHRDLAGGDAADRALLTAIRSGDGFGGSRPFTDTGWFRIVDSPDLAEWLHEQSPGRVDARVSYRRDSSGWLYATSALGGPCVPRRAQYAGDDSSLDSAEAMGTTLLLVISHGTCGPDLAPTDVVETEDTVTLTVHSLTATPQASDGSFCGGVQRTLTVPVGLRSPLGSRTVLDGRYFPALPVPLR